MTDWLWLLLVALVLAAGGCGGSSPPSDDLSDPNESSEPAAPSPPPPASQPAGQENDSAASEESQGAESSSQDSTEPDSTEPSEATSHESSQSSESSGAMAEEASQEPAEESAEPPAEESGKKRPVGKKGAKKGQAAKPGPKPRTDDVTTWTPEDFRAAKAGRDPRLVDAVAYLGEFQAADVQAATLLRELLTVSESPESEPGPDPPKPKTAQPSSDEENSDESSEDSSSDEESSDESGSDGGGQDEESSEEDSPEEDSSSEDSSDEESSGEDQQDSAMEKVGTVPPLMPAYLGLCGAIIRALGANGTPEARQTIQQLLSGAVPTGDDRGATCGALKALVDHPCLENEVVLYWALTAAEKYRPAPLGPFAPAGQGATASQTITAEELRTAVLGLVEQSASMRLRLELSRYLTRPTPSPTVAPRLAMLIRASHPYNVAAQIDLYAKGTLNQATQLKRTFEAYFTTYSALALGRILGLPTAPGAGPGRRYPLAGRRGGPRAGDGFGAAGASLFADAPPIQESASRSEMSDSGDENSDESNQDEEPQEDSSDDSNSNDSGSDGGGQDEEGGNQESDEEGSSAESQSREAAQGPRGPSEPVDQSVEAFLATAADRPSLAFELGQQLWSPGFSAMLQAGLAAAAPADSGQLLALASAVPTDAARAELLKWLLQRWTSGPELLTLASPLPAQGIKDPGFLVLVKTLPRKPSGKGAPGTVQAKEDEVQFGWLRASYEMATSYCKRFQTAARASGQQSEALATLPFQLPPDARPAAVYYTDWTKRAAGRMAGVSVDPMVVHYVRIEETKELAKVQGFYKRAVPLATERERKEQGVVWYDSLSDGSQPGRRRSIDVIITRSRPQPMAEMAPERPGPRGKRRGYTAPPRPVVVGEEPLVIEILSIEINNPAPLQAPAPAKAG